MGIYVSGAGGSNAAQGLLGGAVLFGGLTSMTADAVHHIVLRREAGTTSKWIDGALVDSTGTAPVNPTGGIDVRMHGDGGAAFGTKAFIALYDRALSDAEIAADYAAMT